jgi:hypothetical protein
VRSSKADQVWCARREHGAAMVVCGMAQHGRVKPWGGLIFSLGQRPGRVRFRKQWERQLCGGTGEHEPAESRADRGGQWRGATPVGHRRSS